MDSSVVNSYLDSFVNFESKLHQLRPADFSLDRIQEFLELAGHPAANLKIIHVAGTKGKGSTCAFLACILQEAGLKVGLYTSPHLYKVNERIRILSKENLGSAGVFSGAVSDDGIGSIIEFLQPLVTQMRDEGGFLTYFEFLTVVALCYFAKAQVDVVILETGLGGRLDATNAVDSSIAVITPISLDHTKILGSTLQKIASEKAGIIKNKRQRVVIAPQAKEVMEVLLKRCQEFGIQPQLVVLKDKLDSGLKGGHQQVNAATAVGIVNILRTMGFKISEEAIGKGLKNVRWPGRFEIIRKNPGVILDCAHNEASAQALSQTLKEEYPHQRIILILGISEDKDAAAICKYLKDNANYVILTQANHPRAHAFTQIEGTDYLGGKSFEITGNLPQAIEKALSLASPEDIIVVTGSVFIVAEARKELCTNTKV